MGEGGNCKVEVAREYDGYLRPVDLWFVLPSAHMCKLGERGGGVSIY